MIDVRPFKLRDLLKFKPLLTFPDLHADMKWSSEQTHIDLMTFWNEKEEPICFVGIIHLRQGVAEAFVIRGVKIPDHKFDFYKRIVALLDNCLHPDGFNLHRLQLSISCDWMGGDKWARSIGFSYEGIARNYQMGQDCAMYARLREVA